MKAYKTAYNIDNTILDLMLYDAKQGVTKHNWFIVSYVHDEGLILSGAEVTRVFRRARNEVDVYGCRLK